VATSDDKTWFNEHPLIVLHHFENYRMEVDGRLRETPERRAFGPASPVGGSALKLSVSSPLGVATLANHPDILRLRALLTLGDLKLYDLTFF
jgi:hypothetical protein